MLHMVSVCYVLRAYSPMNAQRLVDVDRDKVIVPASCTRRKNRVRHGGPLEETVDGANIGLLFLGSESRPRVEYVTVVLRCFRLCSSLSRYHTSPCVQLPWLDCNRWNSSCFQHVEGFQWLEIGVHLVWRSHIVALVDQRALPD